jgi:hypothetical protein
MRSGADERGARGALRPWRPLRTPLAVSTFAARGRSAPCRLRFRLSQTEVRQAVGSGHGYKHGIMLGEYVANRVVGRDKHPELTDIFKLKERSF